MKQQPLSGQRSIEARDIIRIQQDYNNAVAYQHSDPAACMGTSRRIAEDICTQVLRAETPHDPGGLMLHKLIGKLTAENVLPSYIIASLQTVKILGNLGAHPQGRDAEHLPKFVQSCLDSLYIVVAWYVETYQTPETGGAEHVPKPIRPQELAQKSPVVVEEDHQRSDIVQSNHTIYVTPQPVPSQAATGTFLQLKRKTLTAKLDDLYRKYEVANAQLMSTLSEVDKISIQRQVAQLEQQIQDTEGQLNQLK